MTPSDLPARRAGLALFLLVSVLPVPQAFASATPPGAPAAAPGTVTGRVRHAITGRYLNNARVTVRGSDALALTDESGTYQLPGVPAGRIELEVFYTGLDSRRVAVDVPAGGTVPQDVDLTSARLTGTGEGPLKLDPFVVAAIQETSGTALAINEQRFAPNIKSVVAVETNGDATNNVGDFLKFVPGVQMQGGTSTSEPETVFVRGFPPNLTKVTSDGAAISSTDANGDQRQVMLTGVSINNFSRVEVVKVPTPATAADTMAGSINLVSKRAFDRSRAEFRYQISLVGNSKDLSLAREPFPNETRLRPIRPAFNVDYTVPFGTRFGLVLSAAHSDYFINGDWVTRNWTTSGTGTGASIDRPYVSSVELRENKKRMEKDTVNLRADWRLSPHGILSAGVTAMYTSQLQRANALTFDAGTVGTSTVAGGTALTYTPDSTSGATGRGQVTYGGGGGSLDVQTATARGNVRYDFDNGDWKIAALAAQSAARYWLRTLDHDTFGILTATLKTPARVVFTGMGPDGPARTQVFNNANQEIDAYDPRNFNLTGITGRQLDNRDEIQTANLDVKRRLGFLSFPAAVQVGGALNRQSREKATTDPRFTYQGPNGDQSASPFLATVYTHRRLAHQNVDRDVPLLSSERGYEAWQKTPSLFVMTPAQQVTAEVARIAAHQTIDEDVAAGYLQVDARFFRNRLHVLTGVRYERTTDDGRGALVDNAAVLVRNPDRTFAKSPTGARIRKPEAGAVGSMAEALLVNQELGYHAERSYDGFYPSLHLNYSLRPNLLLRAAYAKTYGRPNFRDIIPSATVNENDVDQSAGSTAVKGTIRVTNTGLLPWSADNYDLSLEYYSELGGLFGASWFHKDLKDFFGTLAKVANASDVELLGLGPEYIGWQVNSTINAGNAQVRGFELTMNHSLKPLGGWGRFFNLFANYTKLNFSGASSANFTGFLPSNANGGITFTHKPVILTAKLNHRADQTTGPFAAYGPEAIRYYPARTHLDLDLDFQLRRNLSLFANARNLLNVRSGFYQRGSQTPAYAVRFQTVEYGVNFNLGLKASF